MSPCGKYMSVNEGKRLLRILAQIKKSSDFNRLYFLKSKIQKRIKVQPTSICRRRPGSSRSARKIQYGRPQVQNKLKRKRKRNLNENINEN